MGTCFLRRLAILAIRARNRKMEREPGGTHTKFTKRSWLVYFAVTMGDGTFHWPIRVGNGILLCGRKDSSFPYQAFVGPEWWCMCVTYAFLVVPTVFFIKFIAIYWNPVIVAAAFLLLFAAVLSFSFTACSDPGIIFDRRVDDDEQESIEIELESGERTVTNRRKPLLISEMTSHNEVRYVECGICRIDRPTTASHCYTCGICVDELDHHCPWTGKCIGKKNLFFFYMFLWSLFSLIIFVMVIVVMSSVQGVGIFSRD